MEKKITTPKGGLHKDNSYVDQPENTVTYALNAVAESDTGDTLYPSTEESNVADAKLPAGYTPLNSVYIGNNITAIFSVSADETTSEIGVVNMSGEYTTHVNSTELGFKLSHQIDATYRLRRGCQRTVYFVDGHNNVPRFYDFDSPENFKTGGNWDPSKFSLIRTYAGVPDFSEIKVLDVGGALEAGGYNVSLRYIDENLNPTEFIASTEIISIYNSSLDGEYLDIEGSINIGTGSEFEDYRDFPATTKAIKVVVQNIDTSFLSYQLAFIQATTGNGQVSEVRYTDAIPTSSTTFIYTGTNAPNQGTEVEVAAFNTVISSADHIEQVENKLLLANTRGKEVNFCNLQKYASRIRVDMVTRRVFSNALVDGNGKSPTVRFEGVGEMPGEIVSYGIVYVFDDGTVTPTYHIPGKNPNVPSTTVFSAGDDVYPMSNNNQSVSNLYTDNDTCGVGSSWGYDSEGETLQDKQVRHHRLPLRSEIGLSLISEDEAGAVANTTTLFQVHIEASGDMPLSVFCEEGDTGCTEDIKPMTQARLNYTIDGVPAFLILQINPSVESNPIALSADSDLLTSTNIVLGTVEESADDGTFAEVTGVSPKGLTYVTAVQDAVFTAESKLYFTDLFGLKFSGVDLPPTYDTAGERIVGYYIVRNERTEDEKTILDSAALVPGVKNSKYISHGLLGSKFSDDSKMSRKVFGMIHPEHKFRDQKYPNISSIKQEGAFDIVERKHSKSRYKDVQDGTGYQGSVHKSGTNDGDGWSLKSITRDNILRFKKIYGIFDKTIDEIESVTYLNALESFDIDNGSTSVFNIAADNKVGILELKDDVTGPIRDRIPYVYLKRDLTDPYSTFRTLPYYKVSQNVETESTTSTFGGDTYVSPMRYINTVFWDNRIAERAGKTSALNYIIGGILIVVGAILTIWGVGVPIFAAGVAIVGGGALFISSGIKRDNMVKAYSEEYEKGLRETALDDWVEGEYK